MDDNLVAVIMAGGVGTRFWPLSTKKKPKQFIPIFDNRSLLKQSYERVKGIIPDERIFVLTNASYTHWVAEQVPGLPAENIVGEPERRDTAAVVCLGALIARKCFGNPTIIVLTGDHLIEPLDLFRRHMCSALDRARSSGALYTFGVQPTYPASAYGYLELGEPLEKDEREGTAHYRLAGFKEKPDVRTAEQYLASGRYLWNSGMFAWTADAILEELSRRLPGHIKALSQAVEKWKTSGWEEALKRSFASIQRISIDYAVMEKADDVRCAVCRFSWKDVGGWLAMEDFLEEDDQRNHIQGRALTLDASNNLIYCADVNETVVVVGVDNLVVARAGDKTLIVPKDRLEEVKGLTERLKENERD